MGLGVRVLRVGCVSFRGFLPNPKLSRRDANHPLEVGHPLLRLEELYPQQYDRRSMK
jgi:hypothetical protein